MEPKSTLFAQVGRVSRAPVDARARAFQLVLALGLLLATVAFLAELGSRTARLNVVEVDMRAAPPE